MTARWNPPTPIADVFQQINEGKFFAEEGNQIINEIQLLRLFYDNVHASILFNETLKTWREKPDIDKTYANFAPFMTQQEEDCPSNQATSGTTGYSNAMIDRILHDKMQEFINQMGPLYHSPYEEESGNDKNCSLNISTTTSANAVIMESIEQKFHKKIQDKNSKSNVRNNNKSPLVAQGYYVNGIPITVGTVSNGYNRTCPLPRIGVSLRHVDKVPRGRALVQTRISTSSTAREFPHGNS